MTRAQRVGAVFAAVSVSYVLVWLSILRVPFVEEKIVQEIMPLLPFWGLVSFGSYALWSLGMGLVTFRDCDQAHEELLKEISQAKTDLRARGLQIE